MDSNSLESYFTKWRKTFPKFDEPLEIRRTKEIDIFEPNWRDEASKPPFHDNQELRTRFLTLTDELLDAYLDCDESQSAMIREFLSDYKGIRNFMSISTDNIKTSKDVQVFRRALAFKSIEGLGYDTRDAIVSLSSLCKVGAKATIDISPHLFTIAAISSTEDKHNLGSMRDLFLERAYKYAKSGKVDGKIEYYNRRIDSLEKQLQHQNFRVRYKAVDVLGEIGTDRAIRLLLMAIGMDVNDDFDSKINLHASGALLKIGDIALPSMLSAFEGDGSTTPWGRYWLARSLGRFQDPDVFNSLINTLDKENGPIVEGIAEALVRYGDKRAVTHLRAKLEKESIISNITVAISNAIDELLGQPIYTTFKQFEDKKNRIESPKPTSANVAKKPERKPVHTVLGFLAGRDAIYLDKLILEKGNLILQGSFNGHLASEINNAGMIDFRLEFIGVLAFKSIELDSWDFSCVSSFDEITNSKWCANLGGKVTTNHKHYSIQTYDDVIDVVCDGFELLLK